MSHNTILPDKGLVELLCSMVGGQVVLLDISLTLHGEGLPGHGDVVLPLGGEAGVGQVVVLGKLHQRVVWKEEGGGQRLGTRSCER